jgi:RNA polymerase sigma-70 factor, ECF subfamily
VESVDSFNEFFELHYGAVLRLVRAVVASPDRAEDVTQEAFARACQRWAKVGRMEHPVSWIYVVALNEERRRWRRVRRDENTLTPEAPVPDHAPVVLTSVELRDALATLTPRQRAAVLLRYTADLPVADIARALGCADGTVKATLHQALRRLRIELEDDDAN